MSKVTASRLDKLLANMGYGSRKDAQHMVFSGRVTLDGDVLKKPDAHITISPDLPARMRIDNAPLDPLHGMVIMLNKPIGVTCSHKDAGALVYELLPERWRARNPQISTVGRLDKETSGLLLLTDDGALMHRIISPKSGVKKVYEVTTARAIAPETVSLFASGTLMLESEKIPLLPAELTIVSPTTATLVLHEGRYHQVRRMFAATGNHVEALRRSQLGGLKLPDNLKEGEFSILTPAQVDSIFSK